MPVTAPPDTVAVAVLLLLHEPDEPVCVNVTECPTHTVVAPLMLPADGEPLIVITFVAIALPHATTPASVIVPPTHTPVEPVIVPADSAAPIVTTTEVDAVPHALVTVYMIVSIVLGVTPVTTPAIETVALPFVALQIPPGTP